VEMPSQAATPQASSKMALDTDNFPFKYYLKILQGKIAGNWEWPVDAGVWKTVVFFQVDRGGAAYGLRGEQSSGDYLFDQAALMAVSRSLPLMPLPDAYPDEQLGVYFEFDYHE